jgi:hypothetical protein
VHLEDQVPVLVLHVLEADVAQDTGVVDEHVDAAEGLDGRVDDLVAVLDAVVVGDGLAARGLDLVDDDIGGLQESAHKPSKCAEVETHLAVGPLALERAAEVVHHYAGAAGRKEGGISLAETAARAGDDNDLAVEPQLIRHVWSLQRCVEMRRKAGKRKE